MSTGLPIHQVTLRLHLNMWSSRWMDVGLPLRLWLAILHRAIRVRYEWMHGTEGGLKNYQFQSIWLKFSSLVHQPFFSVWFDMIWLNFTFTFVIYCSWLRFFSPYLQALLEAQREPLTNGSFWNKGQPEQPINHRFRHCHMTACWAVSLGLLDITVTFFRNGPFKTTDPVNQLFSMVTSVDDKQLVPFLPCFNKSVC